MTPFSLPGSRYALGPYLARRLRALCGASLALSLALSLSLGACAHDGMDNVKPTATTAYHDATPPAPAPAPAAPQP